ncbi:hypothetical protein KQY27_02460 [Methanobrevibacter sp. TMH8]|uniref:hypothetical protein n=1 Tax=Methanobrevibacter sp. TMH8 TaxID=2848611 RepID=UPI001CCD3A4A|nr:hypothetical protein [Methanobrevibacter sp. TMH8]MBZ9570406.1 hypothetical protein [Methanobrevibacter sp. TMH8]
MTTTVKTTLNLNKDIMRNIKIIALNKETTQTKVINDLLEKAIEKEDDIFKKNPNIKIIKNPPLKKPKRSFDELIGSVKAPKGFDAVKAVKDVRKGKY